jgi:cytochrome b6-f complex iron-sulfur subunit
MSREGDPRSPSRRRFVDRAGRLTAACCAAPLFSLLPGCQGSPPEETGPLTVALNDLPFGVRTRFMHGDRPVELYRDFEGVRARSLLCTHQGCNVRWVEAEGIYLCPCHDGKFDPEGNPIFGPPTEPLRELEVTVTDTEVIVGG